VVNEALMNFLKLFASISFQQKFAGNHFSMKNLHLKKSSKSTKGLIHSGMQKRRFLIIFAEKTENLNNLLFIYLISSIMFASFLKTSNLST